ncbi:pilus assembly protein TadG-related protein [Streptomyces xanthophaeus]
MIRRRLREDTGQAFPLYAVFVVILLFAALALFTVGKAGVVRSNAQGAADAAALGAAREARDRLVPGVDLVALSPQDWAKVLRGDLFGAGACGAADSFAERNDATVECSQKSLTFTVEVMTDGAVGDSVVPGVSGRRGTANATAEITPRCQLKQEGGGSGQEPPPQVPPTVPDKPSPIEFKCTKGKSITFDPASPRPWSELGRALFDIRLID